MSDAYGYAPRSGARDRITQALMRIANPPPGNLLQGQAPVMTPPPELSAQQATAQQPPLPGMPQTQQAGLGAMGAPMGAMGPVGGPYQPGLALPGVQPPGQLPQGMRPQSALSGY